MPLTVPNDTTALANAAPNSLQADLDAVDIDIIAAGLQRTGVITGCGVAQHLAGTMNVDVAAGSVIVQNGAPIAISATMLTIAANGTVNPRFDLIYADASGVHVSAGTASSTPEACFPALHRDGSGTVDVVVLASVLVIAGATAILGMHLIDKRVQLSLRESKVAEWSANGTVQVTTGKIRAGIVGNWRLTRMIVRMGTAPSGAGCNLNVVQNGTTALFSTDVTVNTGEDFHVAVPNITALADGDYLTVNILAGDGTDIVVTLFGYPA